MVNGVNFIPAKHQHADIVIVSMLKLEFSSCSLEY